MLFDVLKQTFPETRPFDSTTLPPVLVPPRQYQSLPSAFALLIMAFPVFYGYHIPSFSATIILVTNPWCVFLKFFTSFFPAGMAADFA